jgi:hypothetical protein
MENCLKFTLSHVFKKDRKEIEIISFEKKRKKRFIGQQTIEESLYI